MKFNEVISLLSIRGASIATQLFTSILLVKITDLNELGIYYSLYTISYLGNCVTFIGYDFVLQKRLRLLSICRKIKFLQFILGFLKIIPAGFFITLIFAFLYLKYLTPLSYLQVGLLCSFVAVGIYSLTFFRNVLLLGAKKKIYAISFFIENMIRILCIYLIYILNDYSIASTDILLAFFIAYAITSLILILCIHKSFASIDGNSINYFDVTKAEIQNILLPVGASSVIYLLHLQGYRPLLGFISNEYFELIGLVSFLMTLGATASNAILTLVSQYWVPKQFSSSGLKTYEYLKSLIFILTILIILSWPVGQIFIYLLDNPKFFGLALIVTFGVAVEGCNFILSSLGNNSNLRYGNYHYVLKGGVLGFLSSLLLFLLILLIHKITPVTLCLSILLGQITAVWLIIREQGYNLDAKKSTKTTI